jgi:death-on-curing protein
MTPEPIFLSVAEVLAIHKNQVELYGGEKGVRDLSLLTSAVTIPESTFGGEYLYKDVFGMAAAYAYHICMNHPFIDGNKRTALVAALVFLDFNGIQIDDPEEILYETMMSIASGEKQKEYLADVLRKLGTKEDTVK